VGLLNQTIHSLYLEPDTAEVFNPFVVEAKAPSNNSNSHDFDKFGNQLKIMLDRLIN
jgi:hypothetical protein